MVPKSIIWWMCWWIWFSVLSSSYVDSNMVSMRYYLLVIFFLNLCFLTRSTLKNWKTSKSLGVTESVISNSAVHSIYPSTWCTHSNMPFARGFLTVVGLRVIPYDSHRFSKCSLNSLPLSYIKWQHRRYLHNQVLFTNLAVRSEVLSKILSAIYSSLPLTICQRSCLTTGNSAILNQLEAGLIMVRAIKSICKLSLPLRVYRPMRSTHKHSQGIV